MENKPPPNRQGPSALSRALAQALPFEQAWLRYLACLWLALALGAAAWALLAIQPASQQRLARSSYLFELEANLQQAQAEALALDLPTLQAQADATQKQLHDTPAALDQSILHIIDQLRLQGWKALVSNVERDLASSERLARATYHVELRKDNPPSDKAAPENPQASPHIHALLETITSSPKPIAIDQLEIQSSDGQPAKVFAKLSAAALK